MHDEYLCAFCFASCVCARVCVSVTCGVWHVHVCVVLVSCVCVCVGVGSCPRGVFCVRVDVCVCLATDLEFVEVRV